MKNALCIWDPPFINYDKGMYFTPGISLQLDQALPMLANILIQSYKRKSHYLPNIKILVCFLH